MSDLAAVTTDSGGAHVELAGAYVADTVDTFAYADRTAFPTLVFEVSANADPLAASPSWTDMTAWLDTFTVTRGRSGEGGLAPGSATFTLDDPDRVLEGGVLLPSRRVRLRATYPASKPIFDGFIDNPQRTYSRQRGVYWTLPCYDLLQFVAAQDTSVLPEGAGNGETTGARINRMLDLVGVPGSMRDIDTGISTCTGHSGNGSALSEIERAVDTEYGHAWVTADGVLTFRERHNLPTSYMIAASSDVHAPGELTVSSSLDRITTVMTVNWADGTVTGEDATARGLYGPRSTQVDTMLTRQTQAQALLEWRLLREATPQDHVPTLSWSPVTDPATIWALLQVDLFDRVSYSRTASPYQPAAPTFLGFDMFCEGLQWSGQGMEISCTMGLAPFIDSGDVWSWSDPWDNTDGLVWSF